MKRRIEFKSLLDALAFVNKHGGPVEDVTESELEDCGAYYIPAGAFSLAGSAVKLKDGSYFIVEAYDHGPLSELTPDVDFGVTMIGFE